jgi:cytochrome c
MSAVKQSAMSVTAVMAVTMVAAPRKAAALLAACVLLGPAVRAADAPGPRLFEEKRCYICHEMDKVSLGPPLKAIAARHAARRDVMTEVLAHKIVHGGGGTWGVVPMVPNQWVSLDEARVLSGWILGLK